MLENVGADDCIKRRCRNLQIKLFNITRPDLVQPLPRHRRSPGIKLDARDRSILALLDRFPQPPSPAPNVEHPLSSHCHEPHHLRPRIAEIKRIGLCGPIGRVQPNGTNLRLTRRGPPD